MNPIAGYFAFNANACIGQNGSGHHGDEQQNKAAHAVYSEFNAVGRLPVANGITDGSALVNAKAYQASFG